MCSFITRSIVIAAFAVIVSRDAAAQQTLYGGSGLEFPDNVGALITINQSNGSGTVVGTPVSGFGLSGLSFNSLGALYGTTVVGTTGSASSLIVINPTNGSLVLNIGIVMADAQALKIGELAFQPSTNTLYGITANGGPGGSPGPGWLYTIDPTTGAATLVGDTGSGRGALGLAFAPDGTLFSSATNVLRTLNLATGGVLTSVPVTGSFDALGVRSDGTLFASTGGNGDIYTIDPGTGARTLLGNSLLLNSVSALAFSPVPEPTTWSLLLIGAGTVACAARRRLRC